ncbi:DEAD-box ATP-dependent RNA helicase 17 [Amborella trichopoda]|uniref:ATP-dependent RNA helicase n=1 Tax=Amborella trichopoda TaxID=13333 RepID=W1P6Q6_AMBTC|nr:DEAD-box ATP-dependent RNA helicase 17 [Amborella trichopoda]ERN05567.1 hypothetical protein AMTR_s00007p00266810 [Amborella trichopoda]|eukprot:XP_006843892.1 DEAD-box ATP-dependent RNA helicase 17 [Amborella trichopoda]
MGVPPETSVHKTLSPTLNQGKTTSMREPSECQKTPCSKSEVFAGCSFSELGLNPALCNQLQERMGFETPTRIQAQSIPTIISGRHVLVNAATGTGKTIAYLAPIIHSLITYDPKVKRSDGTLALVLVPTRELCMQVYEILQKLLHRFHWIVPGYIMGGENRSKEKARLRKGISILVATPGRLLDHLKHTASFLHNNLRWIIFDEADMILELGFGKEIEEILNILGSRQPEFVGSDDLHMGPSVDQYPKQNLLLSATLNDKVNHLAKISLENPVMIGLEDKKNKTCSDSSITRFGDSNIDGIVNIKVPATLLGSSLEQEYTLPSQLVQRYVKVSGGSRLVVLLSILKSLFEREVSQKVVVFFSTCDAVDFHYSLMNEFRWSSESELSLSSEEQIKKQKFIKCKIFRLHGSMEQEGRRMSFQGFSSEKSALLLCTDVASRGLDFPKVKYIIQYDSPGDATEYVHRVGRTARLGEKGEALLFLQPVELDYLQELLKHGVPLKEFPLHQTLNKFVSHGIKHHNKKLLTPDTHPWVSTLQRALESFISTEPKMKQLAKDTFWSWVRAYTAHRGELKRIFMVKKLHLGHVAKSFALKEQPSLVGKSFQLQVKKRKRDERQNKKHPLKKRKRDTRK